MKVLDEFRRLIAAVNALNASVGELTRASRESGPSEERLESLERDRLQFEAACEGLLMKAEGKLQAANNAEARTRTMKKTYEPFLDPLDSDSEEVEEALPLGYAPTGEEEGLRPVRMDVAPDYKTLALARKFQ